MKHYSSEQIRAMDEYMIKTLGIPGTLLMEKAAEHVSEAALERLPPAGKAAVFCGTGNNGGDGLCAAALLIYEGMKVRVFLIGDEEKMTADTRYMRDKLIRARGVPERFSDCNDIEDYLLSCDVIIDAIFGIGLNSDLRGDAYKAAEMINTASSCTPAEKKPFVLAVDVPSGVHADTGKIMGIAVKADMTITFIAAKKGLFKKPGTTYCGEVVVKTLLLSPEKIDEISSSKEIEKRVKEMYSRVKDVTFMAVQAEIALFEGRLNDCIKILEMAHKLYPESNRLDVFLATAYERTDRITKAIKLWEESYKRRPDDAYLAYRLANAYDLRGWNVKALKQYETAVRLDPDNDDAWAGIVELKREAGDIVKAAEICFDTIGRLKEKGIENMRLYASAFIFALIPRPEAAAGYLEKILEMIKTTEKSNITDCENVIYEILEAIDASNNTDLLPFVLEMIAFIPDIDKEIKDFADKLKSKNRIISLTGIYPPTMINLLQTIDKSCGCEDCENEILSCQCSILYDLSGYRPYIKSLSEKHPGLYALDAAFFDMAMSDSNHAREFNARIRKMEKRDVEPILYRADNSKAGDEARGETYRRGRPKTGRNDPCPCGSGKKYKKCCGR